MQEHTAEDVAEDVEAHVDGEPQLQPHVIEQIVVRMHHDLLDLMELLGVSTCQEGNRECSDRSIDSSA